AEPDQSDLGVDDAGPRDALFVGVYEQLLRDPHVQLDLPQDRREAHVHANVEVDGERPHRVAAELGTKRRGIPASQGGWQRRRYQYLQSARPGTRLAF